jgi:perosamine synthetase
LPTQAAKSSGHRFYNLRPLNYYFFFAALCVLCDERETVVIEIPMSSPDITGEEIDAVNRVLKSPVLSNGPYLTEFENAFAQRVGMDHAVAVNSGTSGLHLCVIAAGVKPGDYAVTTPFSFVASANCVLYEHGIPVFADVDPQTGNLDPTLAEEAVDAIIRGKKSRLRHLPRNGNGNRKAPGRIKAILPVHAYGQPADMGAIMRLALKYEIVSVIEDACEAVGSTCGGKQVGSFGNFAVYAFYPNKQLTTGEGGMIVCRDEAAARLLRSLRNQGRDAFNEWLNHDRLGYNYRMDELSAALGFIQLKRVDELLNKRERVASWYNERLSQMECVEIPFIAKTTTRMSWFVYVIHILNPASRDRVMESLAQRGIPSRPYFTPIHLQTFYADAFGYKRGDFPVSERLGDISLALPFSSVMTEGQVEHVCETLRSVLRS